MSRLDGRLLEVAINEDGEPTAFQVLRIYRAVPAAVSILSIHDHWREWLDTLGIVTPGGEPERDVWSVQTEMGCCELHHMHPPDSIENEQWLLYRWED